MSLSIHTYPLSKAFDTESRYYITLRPTSNRSVGGDVSIGVRRIL